ncbi:MAG: invasion associated locus B family protein [Rhodobacteraceae bacterium]|nr:invasion associated locus B family protein [Paracoccaceae bacterium]
MLKKLVASAFIGMVFALPVAAQELAMVDSETDWSVYVADSPKECFIVSAPTKWSAQREGKAVTVRRGDIRFYISIIPGAQVQNEPSFLAGYPLRQDAPVQMQIRDASFSLYPNAEISAEYAWPRPEDDAGLIAAMRGGTEATVIGTSARGTVTSDVFSLIGFTAAYAKAEEMCR